MVSSSVRRPISLAELPPEVRRRALWRVTLVVLLTWAVIIGAYFALPVGQESDMHVVLRLMVDVAVIVAFVVWQSVRIVRAEYPELRAIRALGSIVAVFLVLFATLYLAISNLEPTEFSEPLSHMRALYFTTTVFASVGFGDITAKTDAAQAVVSIQMILDLLLIGAGVRLLVTAVRTGLSRSGAGPTPRAPRAKRPQA